uniref:Ribonuclease H protein At1g65750 family n=1 Tax=Cajanus cajan TaxID=3821 RepID=A0A151R5K3_CAJCA|nr:Putative ribonuclease H protein At1g65750 family [Cajanus cajan]
MERYAQLLNCKLLKLHFIYLGLPIGANPRRKEIWNLVVEKIKRRLSNWKGKVLSMAGRVQLINSVLTSLPLYYLSFYKIPKGVSSEISRLQRQFLWGSNQGTKKMAWIKWEKVIVSKEKGGGWVEGEGNWRFRWSDQTVVSHIEMEQELGQVLRGWQPTINQTDWWFWRSKVDGVFLVKEAYKVIESESRPEEEGTLFKQIWSIKAPPKALIFLWRIVNRGIPSVDILKRRNLILDEQQSIRVLCNKVEEIVSYLFCTCQEVDNIWKSLLNWINCPSSLPQEVAHHFNFIPTPLSSNLQIQAWRTLWLATTRMVWKNRNKGRFKGEIFNLENTIREITCTSWKWMRLLNKQFTIPFAQWLCNPGQCLLSLVV